METFVIILVGAVVYLFPTLVAWDNRVRSRWTIAVVNVLLGWTLIGWVVALAMAVQMERETEKPA